MNKSRDLLIIDDVLITSQRLKHRRYDCRARTAIPAGGLGNLALAGLAVNPRIATHIDNALGTNASGAMEGGSNNIANGTNNLINGNGIQRGTTIGEIGGAVLGSKGLSAGLGLGGNLLRSATTADGFLFGSVSVKAPFNIPVQRFGAMSISGESAFGLRTGNSPFVARTFNAILLSWNNLTNHTTGTIPKGTSLRLGITAPQFSSGLRFTGGLPQFNIQPRLVVNQTTKLVN